MPQFSVYTSRGAAFVWRQSDPPEGPGAGTAAPRAKFVLLCRTSAFVFVKARASATVPTIEVPAGSLTLAAFAPTVTAPALVEVVAGALTLTGFAPDVQVTSGTTVQVPAGSLTLTGYAPTVNAPATVSVDSGSLSLSAYAPTVVVEAASPVPVLSIPGITNVSLTSVRPFVTLTFEQVFPDGLLNLEYDPLWLDDELLSLEEP